MQSTYGNITCRYARGQATRIADCTAVSGSGSQVVVDCMVSFLGAFNSASEPTVVALGCTASTSTTFTNRRVRFTTVPNVFS